MSLRALSRAHRRSAAWALLSFWFWGLMFGLFLLQLALDVPHPWGMGVTSGLSTAYICRRIWREAREVAAEQRGEREIRAPRV